MSLLYPEFAILLFLPLFLWLRGHSFSRLHLALLFMIVALMRPVLKETRQQQRVEGVEAIIALDLSWSMRADDISPSRLEAAKATIRRVVQQDASNRYALYGFTTNALILSPPTSDARLLINALDAIEEENILTHGTSLAALIERVAKRTFPIRNLIIFSDGGEERDLDRLLSLVRHSDIRIIAVGMATHRGALLYDRYGKVLKNEAGGLVVSRLNPLLEKLARKSGGRFIPYSGVDATAQAVQEALHEIARSRHFEKEEVSLRELYRLPLLLSLGLIFFHFVTLPARWLLLIPFLSTQSDGGLLDWYVISQAQEAYRSGAYEKAQHQLEKIEAKSVASEFDRALVLYRRQKYRSALRILQRVRTPDREMKHKIVFLEGNCYAKMGRFTKARISYMQALLLKRDPDVLANLKLILGKKDRSQPRPPVYQKKDSTKAGVAAREKKAKSQKQQTQKGRGKRKTLHRPLGFKAYELINKGYIDEKHPW